MFWHLALAHLIADYPLQTDWMVKHKTRFGVLFLHAAVQLACMVVVALPASLRAWPALLTLAAFHFAVDRGKNWFNLHRPQWRAWPYLLDQFLHFASIGLVSAFIPASSGPGPWLPRPAAVVALGFLLVTYVAMITERVLLSESSGYLPENLAGQAWTRLFWRAGLLGLILLGWGMGSVSLALVLPYAGGRAGLRALLIDVAITVAAAALVIGVNGR